MKTRYFQSNTIIVREIQKHYNIIVETKLFLWNFLRISYVMYDDVGTTCGNTPRTLLLIVIHIRIKYVFFIRYARAALVFVLCVLITISIFVVEPPPYSRTFTINYVLIIHNHYPWDYYYSVHTLRVMSYIFMYGVSIRLLDKTGKKIITY